MAGNKRLGPGVIIAGLAAGAAGALALFLGGAFGGSTIVQSAVSVSAGAAGTPNGSSNGSQGHPFTVTGTFATLYPGTMQYIDLTFVNPNNQALTIPLNGVSVTIKVNPSTTNASCSANNFTFIPSSASASTASVVVAANSTLTVSPQSIPQTRWPAIRMTDSGNQDSCKGSTLTLSYTAGATGS